MPDLEIGALADNGGSTPTHLPQAGSPLLNVALAGTCPAVDQRGVARPLGSACDSGAVERESGCSQVGGAPGLSALLPGALLALRRRRHSV